MCDHSDLGSFSDPESPLASGNPCVGLYEMIPAGVGFSEMLFNSYKTLLSFSFDLVNQCRCSDGCPSCVGPAPENGSGGKLETRALINALLME
jgi:DEAD/DEAH box helicase domain-containing protein